MKSVSAMTLVTLAASLRSIGAVSSCLNPAKSNYRCIFGDSPSTSTTSSSEIELDLYDCGITDSDVADGSLQACFTAFGPSNIVSLALHYNNLSTLPKNVFKGLGSLKSLFLHQNNLGTLPRGVFNGLASLTDLHLHHNELTPLHRHVFKGLGSLQDLSLESNKLTSLHENTLDGLESLRFLNLKDNPLECLPPMPTLRVLFVDDPIAECGEMCANGITGVQGTNIRKQKACCPLTCLNEYGKPQCGLKRCGSRAGGRHECCIRTINEEGEDCADSGKAPCFIASAGGPSTSPMCTADVAGILDGDICCPTTCGSCGGSGCSGFDGGEGFTGGEACCGSGVKDLGRVCSANVGAPCIVV